MRYVRVLIVIVLFFSLIFNGILYMKYSGKRPIFSVNGEGMPKKTFDQFLEDRYGQQSKAQIVREMMIKQAATKAGVWPTDAEIDTLFKETRENNWQYALQLQQTPWAESEARKNLSLQLAVKRLLTKDIPVTDEQRKEIYAAAPDGYDTPNKAYVQCAAILDASRINDIKDLMGRPISDPMVIMKQFPKAVRFIGYDNKLILAQPLDKHTTNQAIFAMKPDEVKVLPPPTSDPSLRSAKALIVKMIKIEPGHKANLDDPKTKELLTTVAAMQRAQPWEEYFRKLYDEHTNLEVEDPNDKNYIETVLFPDSARLKQASK